MPGLGGLGIKPRKSGLSQNNPEKSPASRLLIPAPKVILFAGLVVDMVRFLQIAAFRNSS